jgi:hypothetical protein
MSTHFVTCAPVAILAAFLVVASQAFSSGTLGWIAFAVAIGIVGIVLLAQLDRVRGGVQRVLDSAMVALGGLLVAFGVAASGRAVTWLTFGLGLGIAATAFAGLTLHEVASWRSLNRLPNLRWLSEADRVTLPPQSRAA